MLITPVCFAISVELVSKLNLFAFARSRTPCPGSCWGEKPPLCCRLLVLVRLFLPDFRLEVRCLFPRAERALPYLAIYNISCENKIEIGFLSHCHSRTMQSRSQTKNPPRQPMKNIKRSIRKQQYNPKNLNFLISIPIWLIIHLGSAGLVTPVLRLTRSGSGNRRPPSDARVHGMRLCDLINH